MSNIEDDVKIVKRYLRNSSYKESDSDFFKNGGWEMVDLEIPKAMANILSEREQDKARIKELEEENRIFKNKNVLVNRYFKLKDNSIPKQKVKDVLQNNRNEIFSFTYVDDEQFKPYTMQIDRINKIENELLEEGE